VATQPRKPKAGEPVELRLAVRDRGNANALVSAFDTLHEALLHLVIVRRDLSQFAHEHPVAEPDGSFRLRYTFAAGGDYRLFADLAPKGAGAQILAAKLSMARSGTGVCDIQNAWNENPVAFRVAGECKIALDSPRSSLPVRKTIPLVFTIRDVRTDQPVADLQPYLGAAGHLLLVHEDASTFVHSHPDENAPENATAWPAGSLRFLARFPKPGLYRGWLQIRRGGRGLTADILLQAGVE
jgi:hypothetical protein